MLPYFFIYFYISFQTLKGRQKILSYSYYFIFFVLCLFIGLRDEIGVDWGQYVEIMNNFEFLTLSKSLLSFEPGYNFLSWMGYHLGENIYFINFVASIIFVSGLLSYSNKQEYPWLSILISFPILIVVVGLGYTRQACAIGFEFFALNSFQRMKYYKSLILLFIGSTFHLSLLPITLLFIKKPNKNIYKIKNIIIVSIILVLAILVFNARFSTAIIAYYNNYVKNTYSSAGAIYRIIPSLIASLIIIIKQSKFKKYFGEITNIYIKMAYLIIFMSTIIIFFPQNSTLADRFSLYFTPVTLFVFTKIVKLSLFKIKKIDYLAIFFPTYFFYTFFWLEYAVHSKWFVPYKNILLY